MIKSWECWDVSFSGQVTQVGLRSQVPTAQCHLMSPPLWKPLQLDLLLGLARAFGSEPPDGQHRVLPVAQFPAKSQTHTARAWVQQVKYSGDIFLPSWECPHLLWFRGSGLPAGWAFFPSICWILPWWPLAWGQRGKGQAFAYPLRATASSSTEKTFLCPSPVPITWPTHLSWSSVFTDAHVLVWGLVWVQGTGWQRKQCYNDWWPQVLQICVSPPTCLTCTLPSSQKLLYIMPRFYGSIQLGKQGVCVHPVLPRIGTIWLFLKHGDIPRD